MIKYIGDLLPPGAVFVDHEDQIVIPVVERGPREGYLPAVGGPGGIASTGSDPLPPGAVFVDHHYRGPTPVVAVPLCEGYLTAVGGPVRVVVARGTVGDLGYVVGVGIGIHDVDVFVAIPVTHEGYLP